MEGRPSPSAGNLAIRAKELRSSREDEEETEESCSSDRCQGRAPCLAPSVLSAAPSFDGVLTGLGARSFESIGSLESEELEPVQFQERPESTKESAREACSSSVAHPKEGDRESKAAQRRSKKRIKRKKRIEVVQSIERSVPGVGLAYGNFGGRCALHCGASRKL